MDGKRVLIWCPEAWVTAHYALAILVGRTLLERGHDVWVARCSGDLFERCVAKDGAGLSPFEPTPPELCAKCNDVSSRWAVRYGLETFDLRPYLPGDSAARAAELLRVEPNPFLLRHDGHRLGGLVMHDVTLSRKLSSRTPLDDYVRAQIAQSLETTISAYEAGKALFSAHKFDAVVVFGGQYAPNYALRLAANAAGVAWRTMSHVAHLNVDVRWLNIQRSDSRTHRHDFLSRTWPIWRSLPLSPAEVGSVVEDIVFRSITGGSHVYSPAAGASETLHVQLGLDKSKPLLVAFTSSLDEHEAQDCIDIAFELAPRTNLPDPFPTQLEWLQCLVDRMRGRPDQELVIRVHPREDANKRESVTSWHLSKLRELLVDLPSNVRVVWPREPVSSYDLMELADLVLVGWSTMGLESSRVGVPVVTAFNNKPQLPVNEVMRGADTPAAYLAAIDAALGSPADWENLKRIFRCNIRMRFASALDFSDVVPSSRFGPLPPFTMSARAAALEAEIFGEGPRLSDRKLEEVRRNTTPDSYRLEDVALHNELCRLIHAFFTGELPGQGHGLRIVSTLEAAEDGDEPTLHLAADRVCTYRVGGSVFRRYSPLIHRLAPLVGERPALGAVPERIERRSADMLAATA